MVRLGAIFVAFCIGLIAVSLAAAAYLYFGLSGAEASVLGLTALTALALYNTVATRLSDRNDVGGQIADLSRGTGDLARQVAEIGRRLSALEGRLDQSLSKARAVTDPLQTEIGELGTLVRQLAETVALHDSRLKETAPAAPAVAAAPVAGLVATDGLTGDAPAPERRAPAEGGFRLMNREAMIATVRDAVEENRVDLYLQPVVTLPQRKVRYYEALARLRTPTGEVIAETDFLDLAERSGLLPKIDSLTLFRSVQVVRRLLLKNREVGLFCNVSNSTLVDPVFFPQLVEFVDANRALAPVLVLEFTQAAVRAFGPIEHESLAALAQYGFRFAMDQVNDLRFEPRELADRGFKFVKVSAALLLNRLNPAANDIHSADLSDLLGRFGIDLIVDKIESEGVVVDLLDHDIRFGQGPLFSPPRPVRQEALQSGSRSDPLARSEAAGDETGPAKAGDRPAAKSDGTNGPRAGSLHQLVRGVLDPA